MSLLIDQDDAVHVLEGTRLTLDAIKVMRRVRTLRRVMGQTLKARIRPDQTDMRRLAKLVGMRHVRTVRLRDTNLEIWM